jgi:hypothetical protein
VDAVAAGFSADINYRIADPSGFGEKDVFLSRDAEGERVNQRILRVTRLEANFAANRGHPKGVAVISDATDYSIQDTAIFCRVFT